MSIQISHRPPVQKVSITSRISPPVLRFPLPLLMLSVLSHKSVMLSSSMLLLSFSAMLPPRLEAKAATMAAATPPITPMSFKRFLDFQSPYPLPLRQLPASDREYKSSAQMSGRHCPAFFKRIHHAVVHIVTTAHTLSIVFHRFLDDAAVLFQNIK